MISIGRRGFFWSKQTTKETTVPKNKLRPNRATTMALTVLGLGAYGTYRSVQVVESGHVGVVEILGVVQDDLLTSGLHLVLPWAQVTKISTRQRSALVETHTRIRGGLFVELELRVLYKYKNDPETINEMYTSGKEYHVQSVAKSVLHSVVAKKTMEQMHDTHQVEICGEIRDMLNNIYKKDAVFVQSVVLEKVHLPDYLITAIQDLHKLDLEISQDKRMVDGQLAVARGTAAARSAISGKDPVPKPPIMYQWAMKDAMNKKTNQAARTTSDSTPKQVASASSKEDKEEEVLPEEEKTMLEKWLPFLFAKDDNKRKTDDKAEEKKKLPTLKVYVKQVKEERKMASSFLPALSKKDKEEEQSTVPSKKEAVSALPKEESAAVSLSKVVPEKKNEKKDAALHKTDATVEEAKLPPLKAKPEKEDVALPQADSKVEEAKLPPLKAKPEPASLESSGGTEPTLQEAAPNAKAAGEAEKE